MWVDFRLRVSPIDTLFKRSLSSNTYLPVSSRTSFMARNGDRNPSIVDRFQQKSAKFSPLWQNFEQKLHKDGHLTPDQLPDFGLRIWIKGLLCVHNFGARSKNGPLFTSALNGAPNIRRTSDIISEYSQFYKVMEILSFVWKVSTSVWGQKLEKTLVFMFPTSLIGRLAGT